MYETAKTKVNQEVKTDKIKGMFTNVYSKVSFHI
jgi:hypothetical protein